MSQIACNHTGHLFCTLTLYNTDCSRHFFGRQYDTKELNWDSLFENVYEGLHDMKYDTTVDTSVTSFAEHLREILELS